MITIAMDLEVLAPPVEITMTTADRTPGQIGTTSMEETGILQRVCPLVTDMMTAT